MNAFQNHRGDRFFAKRRIVRIARNQFFGGLV
jgi:hypothetical protein